MQHPVLVTTVERRGEISLNHNHQVSLGSPDCCTRSPAPFCSQINYKSNWLHHSIRFITLMAWIIDNWYTLPKTTSFFWTGISQGIDPMIIRQPIFNHSHWNVVWMETSWDNVSLKLNNAWNKKLYRPVLISSPGETENGWILYMVLLYRFTTDEVVDYQEKSICSGFLFNTSAEQHKNGLLWSSPPIVCQMVILANSPSFSPPAIFESLYQCPLDKALVRVTPSLQWLTLDWSWDEMTRYPSTPIPRRSEHDWLVIWPYLQKIELTWSFRWIRGVQWYSK